MVERITYLFLYTSVAEEIFQVEYCSLVLRTFPTKEYVHCILLKKALDYVTCISL